MSAGDQRDDRRKERVRAYRWGLSAEGVASLYLRLKGYRVLARRHKTPFGEIDLIVRRGGLIAFVEVKARAGHLDAIEAVGAKSRRRIIAAASHWGARYPEVADLSWRYDIVSIVPWRRPRHLVDAFRPES
jgi:putative endonuclease